MQFVPHLHSPRGSNPSWPCPLTQWLGTSFLQLSLARCTSESSRWGTPSLWVPWSQAPSPITASAVHKASMAQRCSAVHQMSMSRKHSPVALMILKPEKFLSTHPVSDLQKGQFPFEHRFFKSQIHLQGGFRHKRQTTLGKNKKHLESRNSIGLWTRCLNSWEEVRAGVEKDRELMKVTSAQARFIKKKKGIFCFIIFLTHNQHLKVAPVTLLSSAYFTD